MAEQPQRSGGVGVLVLSVGGSLIVPTTSGPDVEFLSRFARLITAERKRWRKILLVCGGGRTARTYIDGARRILGELHELPPEDDELDLDGWVEDQHWLGIHATRVNAHLLRTVFRKHAYRRVLTSPERVPAEAVQSRARIVICAGWKPGWSTDYVATRMAKVFRAKTVVNLTNVDHVYDRDPRESGAQPLLEVSWEEYFRRFPARAFNPGDNTPFDPVAASFAARNHTRIIVLKGSNVQNLSRFLAGGPYQDRFKGTVIGGRARQGNVA